MVPSPALPASRTGFVPVFSLMEGYREGMKGKETCGEEVSLVTEGQMLSVS